MHFRRNDDGQFFCAPVKISSSESRRALFEQAAEIFFVGDVFRAFFIPVKLGIDLYSTGAVRGDDADIFLARFPDLAWQSFMRDNIRKNLSPDFCVKGDSI